MCSYFIDIESRPRGFILTADGPLSSITTICTNVPASSLRPLRFLNGLSFLHLLRRVLRSFPPATMPSSVPPAPMVQPIFPNPQSLHLLHCFTITPPHTPWSQSAQPLFQSKPNLSPIRYQPSRLEASINLWQPCKSNLPTTDPLQNTPNPTSTSHPPSPIHPLLLHAHQPPLNLLLIRANP